MCIRDSVAFVPEEEIAGIEGFDESVVSELHRRANAFLEIRNAEFDTKRKELGVADEVAAIEGLTPAMLVILGDNGVKSLDDLGDLASDEFLEVLPDAGFTAEEADAIIMAARAHWFDNESTPASAAPGDASAKESPSEERSAEEPLAEG